MSLDRDTWAEAVAKITGRPKEKLLLALEWGATQLRGMVSETELKALATIAADEKGVIV